MRIRTLIALAAVLLNAYLWACWLPAGMAQPVPPATAHACLTPQPSTGAPCLNWGRIEDD